MSEQEATNEDPNDAAAAAEAAVSEAVAYVAPSEAAASANTNKWSKNGFGEPCARTGGKFTREETETVRRAVEEYCAMRQIPTSRLCSECDHKAELKGAWMEIAKRLPHRTVQSVYRHGLRQLHPFKRGPWSEQECQSLLELVQRMGKKWSAIQGKLNRSADSCRDKYREMSTEYVKGRWKENETEILKRLIREHLRADPNADIKELGKMVEREGLIIPWSTISKRMAKRSRLSCFKKWQKMTGLYSPSDQHKSTGVAGAGVVVNTAVAGSGVVATGAAQVVATAAAAAPPPPPPPQAAGLGLEQTQPQLLPAAPTAPDAMMKDESGVVEQIATAAAVVVEARNAPTAGAAAAAQAAAMVSNQAETDVDLFILSELVNSGATRDSDVDWTSWRIENARARWNQILEEWQDETQPDDNVLELPICEIAQMLLERKEQAKMAAETVEAVDLPTLKREV